MIRFSNEIGHKIKSPCNCSLCFFKPLVKKEKVLTGVLRFSVHEKHALISN